MPKDIKISELSFAGPPLCCFWHETLNDVVVSMLNNDFSQLPVIDEDGSLRGFIHYRQVLLFGMRSKSFPPDCRVIDVMDNEPALCFESDEFQKVIDLLERAPAVVVIDAERKPIGLITDFDIAAFLRQESKAFLVIESIEKTLDQLILARFTQSGGEIDEEALKACINTISSRRKDSKPKSSISELTFSEKADVITASSNWPYYHSKLALSRNSIITLLDSVRKIRNDVAHFRGGLTRIDADQLQHCHKTLKSLLSSVLS